MPISEQSNAEINLLRRNSVPGSSSKYVVPGSDICKVCGDGNAKMHYGVVTCFGCKGFFRRTLKRPTEYQCRHNGQCIVDRHERNSCRYCRFKKCIEVGMDPKAVRPDRDATGRHYQGRQRRSKLSTDEEGEVDAEWLRKLPVDMRTTLMQLMNMDLMVGSGDGQVDAKAIYPLPIDSIRRALEDPSILDGKRSEMRYDGYREIEESELPAEAHRRLIAVIDWVDHLFDLMDIQGLDDKLALVKNAFAPLMVFSFSAITAKNCKQEDVICLCHFGYVPRHCTHWNEPYHFANNLAERALDEVIRPFRKMHLKEEELALMKAIIILNPHIKTLTTEASEAIADLRDRIQETLYHVVRETHPKEVASSRFGNLLLFIPTVMMLGTLVMENLQFIDSFGNMTDGLIHDLLKEEPLGSEAMQVNDAPPQRRMSEPQMSHSASSSSIESLNSYPSSSASYSSQENVQSQQPIPYNYSSNSLPAAVSQFDMSISTASSMPNLDQMTDCDPDYNVTLTPDMYSDMRQAMSAAHPIDGQQPPGGGGLPAQNPSPTSPSADRPTFYIESTKHKFAVTTFENTGYPNYPPPMQPQQQPTQMTRMQAPQMNGNYPPPPAMGQPQQQQMMNGHPMMQNGGQCMPPSNVNGNIPNGGHHMQNGMVPNGMVQNGMVQNGMPNGMPMPNGNGQPRMQGYPTQPQLIQQQQQQPLTKANSLPLQYYQYEYAQQPMDYEDNAGGYY